jgi:sucrose-phosphate synthase
LLCAYFASQRLPLRYTQDDMEIARIARLRYGELHLPEPRVWIVQAGSEIRYGPEGSQDLAWQDHIARGWQRRAVEEALAGLAPRLELQAEAQQGAFKVSYMLRPPPAGVLEMVHRRLRQRQLAARAHLFNHWYLDVLPVRASKAEAIRHLARRWQLPLEQILVVAAQQGDGELLSGPGPGVVVGAHAAVSEGLHPRRRKLFFASRPQAWGVLEGIDHHRFLRR